MMFMMKLFIKEKISNSLLQETFQNLQKRKIQENRAENAA